MPIEIRELVIKVNVGGEQPQQPTLPTEDLRRMKREIMDDCVRKVLQELDKRKER